MAVIGRGHGRLLHVDNGVAQMRRRRDPTLQQLKHEVVAAAVMLSAVTAAVMMWSLLR